MKTKYWAAIVVFLGLVALSALNVYKNLTWSEPTDGVTWGEGPNGLTALKVAVNSPAYLASIKKGDILYAINNIPIKTKIDLVKTLWIARDVDQKVSYQIGREGELITPSFYLQKKGVNLIYFYLALVGLTTLVIGLIVFFNSRRRLSLPYVYFYLLSAAFYGFYTFSPTGNFDLLDSVFYWIDRVAFLAFPPLLLHFFMIFPQRKRFLKRRPTILAVIYLPAAALLAFRILFHTVLAPAWNDAEALRFQARLERLDLFHFALFTLFTLATVIHSSRHPASLFLKKQLKFIVTGLSLGIVPFTLFYVVPFMAGRAPSTPAELTVLLQALIPLTFAYSISRYKLMDFEILLKKAVTLIISFFVISLVYYVVSSQTRIFSEYRLNAIILGILAITLGAALFGPLKKLVQTLLDRAIYRRSYEYRKTLLLISREISRERNLQNLSTALLDSIANALSLRTIALYLADEAAPLDVPAPPEPGRGGRRPPVPRFRRGPLRADAAERLPFVLLRLGPEGRPEEDRALHPLRLLPCAPAEGRGKDHRLSGHGTEAGRHLSHERGLGAPDDHLPLRRPGPRERLPLQPGERPGPGDAAAQGLQREHHREPDRGRRRHRPDGSRHRLEPRPRGPVRPEEGGRARREALGHPRSEEFRGHLPLRHPAGFPPPVARSGWSFRAGRSGSSTSPGRPSSTTP